MGTRSWSRLGNREDRRAGSDNSFLDRAPLQEIDLARGIEDITLALRRHELSDIEIATSLPGGRVTVDTGASGTTFEVRLPATV